MKPKKKAVKRVKRTVSKSAEASFERTTKLYANALKRLASK